MVCIADTKEQLDGLHGVIYDTRKRSATKSITYRILIIVLDFAVLYLFTGRLDLSIGFTIVSNIYTSVAYYFHERLWQKIEWGRKGKK